MNLRDIQASMPKDNQNRYAQRETSIIGFIKYGNLWVRKFYIGEGTKKVTLSNLCEELQRMLDFVPANTSIIALAKDDIMDLVFKGDAAENTCDKIHQMLKNRNVERYTSDRQKEFYEYLGTFFPTSYMQHFSMDIESLDYCKGKQ